MISALISICYVIRAVSTVRTWWQGTAIINYWPKQISLSQVLTFNVLVSAMCWVFGVSGRHCCCSNLIQTMKICASQLESVGLQIRQDFTKTWPYILWSFTLMMHTSKRHIFLCKCRFSYFVLTTQTSNNYFIVYWYLMDVKLTFNW